MSSACQRYQICLNRYVTRGLGALYGGIGMTLFLCHQGNPKKTATNGDVLEPNLWKPSSSLLSPTTGAAISKKHGGPNQPTNPAK